MDERTLAGTLNETHINEAVRLKGWVQKRRDLGGLIFIDLRDRTGIIQVVFNPANSPEALAIAEKVRSEYVIEVSGTIVAREDDTINEAMKTGKIEVTANDIVIINKAKNPPFLIEEETDVSEDLRLKYRYLDLRRNSFQKTFKLRHQTKQVIRQFLNNEDFLEMETPLLTKSTPEGARDYLVPSRIHSGEFYALPQSPQLFKQLIMMGGFEKYYQIARCFRDEDLRSDRQPEFTQIDIETSFMTSKEIMAMTERMMQTLLKEVKNIDVPVPFKQITYDKAMSQYGSDKPDTRFDMKLIDISEAVEDSSFMVFKNAIKSKGKVALLNVQGKADDFSRRNIDDLTEFVKVYGAKGLAWLKFVENEFTGPIAKFLSEDEKVDIIERAKVSEGDLLLFVADKPKVVYDSLGALRLKLGKQLSLIDESKTNFLWVTDWPLLEYDETLERYVAAHHPFTMPAREDVNKLTTDPANVRAEAYDLVLNGYELGGGSLRIFKRDLQEKMFEVLGFSKEEANEQFGFLLEALEFGAPPHGGIALGLDRVVMLLAGKTNLRDTILFPKTASASDLLMDAPTEVSDKQLKEIAIQLTKKNDSFK